MILADTSAGVEYDRATGSAVDQRMADLIAEDGPLAVTQPVVMEVVARGTSISTRVCSVVGGPLDAASLRAP